MRNLTVRAKLVLTQGIMTALMATMAVSSLISLGDANDRLADYVSDVNARATLAEGVRDAVARRAIAARNLVLVTTPQDVADEMQAVQQAEAQVKAQLSQLMSMASEPGLPPEVLARAKAIEAVEAQYGPVAADIVAKASSGHHEAAVAKMNADCRPLLHALMVAVEDYVSLAHQRGHQMIAEAEEHHAQQHLILLGLGVVALLSAIGLGWALVRNLWQALGSEPSELNAAALQVASGDLSPIPLAARAPAHSVMAALGTMQGQLAQLVNQVRSSSDSIATGSTQVAVGSAHLSQRTEEQASNLQQASASMMEIRSTVERNAQTAHQARQMADQARNAAHSGGNVMGEVVTTMQDITTSSRKVADIISVIDGIAFQTNILALNAAVEAARAGEQGRGFAVVAGEVRTLAQRSATAAKEIRGLISASVERVETGSRLIETAGSAIGEIVGQVNQVAELITEISDSATGQSTAISQMSDAVSQLDEVTQHNAALVEESTAAAESLRHQASTLADMVGRFRVERMAA